MKPKIIFLFLTSLLLILLFSAGLHYVNSRLVPDLFTSLSQGLESRAGLTIKADSAAYVPFKGLRFTGVRVVSVDGDPGMPLFAAGRLLIDADIIKYLTKGADTEDLIRSADFYDVEICPVPVESLLFLTKGRSVEVPAASPGPPDAEKPDPGSDQAQPRSAAGPDSRGDPGDRKSLDFSRFWDLGTKVTQHRLFPKQLFMYNTIFRCRNNNVESVLPGRVDLQIMLEDSPMSLRIEAEGDNAKLGSVLSFEGRRAEAEISVSDIDIGQLAALFDNAGDYPLVSGSVDFDGRFVSPVPGLIELEGILRGRDLSISHQTLGGEAVSGFALIYDFNLIFDPEASLPPPRILGKATPSNPGIIAAMQESHLRDPSSAWGELRFRKGRLTLNGIVMEFLPALRGIFPQASLPARLDLRLHLPETRAQKILAAVPEGLSGPFARMELSGNISWNLDLEVPLDMIREMNWRSAVSMEDFAVESIPEELNVYKLKRSFFHTLESSGSSRRLHIPEPKIAGLDWMRKNSELTEGQIKRLRAWERHGAPEPKNLGAMQEAGAVPADWPYHYIYLEEMSPWIPLAVLTCEDGDFFFHDGINWLTFRHAVERNISSGGIEVGASTLTMQLIKNLFLNRERVISRKIHEAFLVYLLERDARVSKERILELYINLVEFGPGIIGINEASRHFFGKDPMDISINEAVWMASILPAPRRYYSMYREGRVPDSWWNHMQRYLDVMLERGRLTEEEYRQALAARPVFTHGEQ
ncbi:biosynthetic peptidoglycan transglycosylase [Marispirochaeta sp.]|uniref:biosynthetic peptidoglycan transglycosylase n=1 Tax=Marispirochaeta sp. TaxID=2038653 RepID=UPI0029C62FD7|nr:biosynthetic peptidoglycan transglycosylase [Marispirochaeta sp.]